jgi:acyl transferase domain-containing protein
VTEEIGMLDEAKAVTVRTVNGKPRISDEQTLREMQLAEACEELVAAEREFAEWDAKATQKWAHPDADPANLCHWFDSLERRYKADRNLWLLFTGGDRSMRSNCLYNSFRRHLLRRDGTKLRANA